MLARRCELPLNRVKVKVKDKGIVWLGLLLLFASGCNTLPPLKPANLKEPGWTVREGQAVWRTKKGAPDIAGELLLATRPDGRTFVQFSKTPFPMLIAQRTTIGWEVQIPMKNERHSGRGKPPTRRLLSYLPGMIFLYLPGVLAAEPPPKGWSWEKRPDGSWRLNNGRSGETIEGFLN